MMAPFLLLLGLVIRFYSVFQSRFQKLVFESGDSRFNNLLLEWGYQRLSHLQLRGIWSPPFFYPSQDVLAYSDNLFGNIIFYAPWRLLGFDPYISFQIWMIFGFILSYASVYFVLKKWDVPKNYAAIGAFLFAFSLPILGQVGHSQMLPLFPIPIIFYSLHRYVEFSERRSYLAVFCLTLTLQFYCGIYLGFFVVLMVLIFFIAAVKVHHKNFFAYFRPHSFLFFLLLFCLPVGFLLYPYYLLQKQFGGRNWDEVVSMLPTFRSYFLPNDGSIHSWILSQPWASFPMRYEHWIFIGIIPTLLFLVALCYVIRNWRNMEPIFKIASITACAMMLLTYNFFGLSLWWFVYQWIPGFQAIRAVSRYQCVNVFFIMIMVVYYLRTNEFFRKKWGVLIVPLLLVDLWGTPPFRMNHQELVQRVEKVAKEVDLNELFLLYPYRVDEEASYTLVIDAMWASVQKGAYTINGYSGHENGIYSMLFVFDQLVCTRLNQYVQPVLVKENRPLSIIYLSPPSEDASILNCTEKLYEHDGIVKFRYVDEKAAAL